MREIEPENDLGRTVRELIVASGETAEAVAARCVPPLRPTYLSQIVHGNVKRPGDGRLRALAAGLGVPVEELQRAMLRAAQTEENEVDLPPDLRTAFHRAQRHIPNEERRELYRHIRDELVIVSRPYVEAERGPTNYLPPAEPDR
ncbi:MAG TPA: helix-turn-helix transcriptional regulator [Chloroflexota bacterium]